MDDEDKAIVKDGSTDSRDAILEAAQNCPTDAIIIEDKDTGEKLYPED
jgi:ferredoxin